MQCYYCMRNAQAKIGGAKGNILAGFIGGKVWDKSEKYVCRKHFEIIQRGEDPDA